MPSLLINVWYLDDGTLSGSPRNAALFSAAQTAAIAPRKEVPLLIPGTCSHAANIFLPIWQRGQPATQDVTVISTLLQSTAEGATVTQGYALVVGEERK